MVWYGIFIARLGGGHGENRRGGQPDSTILPIPRIWIFDIILGMTYRLSFETPFFHTTLHKLVYLVSAEQNRYLGSLSHNSRRPGLDIRLFLDLIQVASAF